MIGLMTKKEIEECCDYIKEERCDNIIELIGYLGNKATKRFRLCSENRNSDGSVVNVYRQLV